MIDGKFKLSSRQRFGAAVLAAKMQDEQKRPRLSWITHYDLPSPTTPDHQSVSLYGTRDRHEVYRIHELSSPR
ncbi:hypothetical protein MGG_17254 [Pyricularia oryzae 70-15]|uniref:Uncharacterized protein n=3 Tax=Pyricularia oryzae TaxID=318829 RepID=G4N9L3_PYRO7|nr:uncharacterized protein MGG_17254 [Pyricularia oryzae 70-15]ELQ35676.1 hypothetical protein OOU_Y34scaffold00694g12 [Pyricularia oryzae Y34]KAI6396897.1 hypothetical protein MCOR20_009755 [Pyricularia oryzae]EHA51201.1 hypothetical protein MGG_17254 [Pyricularia oryzae 70-15]KAI6419075.1 hypothetical protein MCOR21_010481 [Pyricularia oryzae]KAI6474386.1 hypothetical protein MCOR18_007859 [Pyricularia oryzae]